MPNAVLVCSRSARAGWRALFVDGTRRVLSAASHGPLVVLGVLLFAAPRSAVAQARLGPMTADSTLVAYDDDGLRLHSADHKRQLKIVRDSVAIKPSPLVTKQYVRTRKTPCIFIIVVMNGPTKATMIEL